MLPFPLLRSVIRCDDEDPEPALAANLFTLRRELEPEGIDKDLLLFIGSIYDRTLTVPAYVLVYDHFKALEVNGDGRGLPGQTRLEALTSSTSAFLPATEFRVALDTYRTALMKETLSRVLVESSTILTSGADRIIRERGKAPTKVRIQGPDPALQYLQESLGALNRRLKRGSVEGSFQKASDTLLQDYERWKHEPSARLGVRSGIGQIDSVHHGLKRGELALILGFVSHMKTTFCMNWAYNAAIRYGHNVGVVTLETQWSILRNLLYVMHSTHPRFVSEEEASLGGIDYDKLTMGVLSAQEEQQFRTVVTDFATNREYGEIFYKEPDGPITIDEIKQWAEGINKTKRLDLIVIDYLALVDVAAGEYAAHDYQNLNLVVRQAKKSLAMGFDNGRGVAVLSPFQSNRDGLVQAEKSGGHYRLTALSGAPEAERSADVVYYTYLDDPLRASRELAVGNIKARNNKLITDQFKCFADAPTRTIRDFNLTDALQAPVTLPIEGAA